MKKLLLALFLSVFSLELLNAQEVTFNDQKELVLKEGAGGFFRGCPCTRLTKI